MKDQTKLNVTAVMAALLLGTIIGAFTSEYINRRGTPAKKEADEKRETTVFDKGFVNGYLSAQSDILDVASKYEGGYYRTDPKTGALSFVFLDEEHPWFPYALDKDGRLRGVPSRSWDNFRVANGIQSRSTGWATFELRSSD